MFFKEPIVQFFIAAAAIFGLFAVLETRANDPVILDDSVRAALVNNFEGIVGRSAHPDEIAQLERDYIIDELLFREALERGMHLTDGQTKKHLTDNLRRLFAGTPPQVSDETLVNYYADNIEKYRGEPTISFRQVFFEERPDAAGVLLDRLNAGEEIEGDPYWMGNRFDNYGDSMIRGVFGNAFLKKLTDLPEAAWAGPINTDRGIHYIYKSGRGPARLVPFAEIRDQVAQDYWAMQTQGNLDRAVEELKEKFDVVVTDAP